MKNVQWSPMFNVILLRMLVTYPTHHSLLSFGVDLLLARLQLTRESPWRLLLTPQLTDVAEESYALSAWFIRTCKCSASIHYLHRLNYAVRLLVRYSYWRLIFVTLTKLENCLGMCTKTFSVRTRIWICDRGKAAVPVAEPQSVPARSGSADFLTNESERQPAEGCYIPAYSYIVTL